MAEFSRKVAVLLWIVPVKGFLQPVLFPRGVYCRHNAVSGCMDGQLFRGLDGGNYCNSFSQVSHPVHVTTAFPFPVMGM